MKKQFPVATATYCELTDEEICLMQKLYNNSSYPERIAAGGSKTAFAECFLFDVAPALSEETLSEEKRYRLMLYQKPGVLQDYVIEDNLYAYLHEDSYYENPSELTVEAILNGTVTRHFIVDGNRILFSTG